MTKAAVGYIRGRRHRGEWTADVELQKQQIREYADAYDYRLIAMKGEEQRLGIRRLANALVAALRLCNRNKADFLYVDFGPRRPNPLLTRFLKETKPETQGWRFVPIPADRMTLEAMERQARAEAYNFRAGPRRKRPPKQADQRAATALEEFKIKFGVSTKRLRNFQHLYRGVNPIYEYLLDPRSSPQKIADDLCDEAYLTVDGKRWTADNVRRTRRLVEGHIFKAFITMKDEERST